MLLVDVVVVVCVYVVDGVDDHADVDVCVDDTVCVYVDVGFCVYCDGDFDGDFLGDDVGFVVDKDVDVGFYFCVGHADAPHHFCSRIISVVPVGFAWRG